MNRHATHDTIVATISALLPWAEVRVIDQPLRRPCDYAVVIDGPQGRYTVAATHPDGWAEVAAVQSAGFDFSASYERIFDRDFAIRSVEWRKPGSTAEQSLRGRIATNAALDAIVAAICHPGT